MLQMLCKLTTNKCCFVALASSSQSVASCLHLPVLLVEKAVPYDLPAACGLQIAVLSLSIIICACRANLGFTVQVVGCIVEHEGKILLCKRAIEPCKGKWTLPAGYMELKESSAGLMFTQHT